MSSSNPLDTRALGGACASTSVALVDAPVSGGDHPRGRAATLTIMVGGDDEAAIERARPCSRSLGGGCSAPGRSGPGHAMKALNNFCGAAAYATLAEALAIGQHFGLEPEVMLDVINTSTGRSFNTEVVFKEEVVTGRYATGFALALLAKDVGIAASLADAAGVDDARAAASGRASAGRRGRRGSVPPAPITPRRTSGWWDSRASPRPRSRGASDGSATMPGETATAIVTKQERVYQAIRERILSGAYGPGYRVVIDALAEEFEVSALPVREAIRRLEAEGLVIYRPNAGRTGRAGRSRACSTRR